MSYVVSSTEKVRGKGADYETKALLYLMNEREDSHEIYCFAIDFYNDVTGLNAYADKAWDLQSKGTETGSAKSIGRELVTLFKNFMSSLSFDYMILFLAAVPNTFRVDNSKSVFGIENISDKALKSVKKGLKEEGEEKEYIDDEWITDENVEKFLRQVSFVIDDKSKAEYIKDIIAVNPKYVPKNDVLDAIFNKIRDVQAAKKNNETVEGEMVDKLGDVFAYDRILRTKEIRLMVLNTFINGDIMNNGFPVYFMPVIAHRDAINQKDTIEDCKLKISTVLFDKANTDKFWDLLDLISGKITENPLANTNAVYNQICDNEAIKIPNLDILSVKYLISVMKEALDDH